MLFRTSEVYHGHLDVHLTLPTAHLQLAVTSYKGSYSKKGVFLPSEYLLEARFSKPPSKNPSQKLVQSLFENPLLRSLLTSVCRRMTP